MIYRKLEDRHLNRYLDLLTDSKLGVLESTGEVHASLTDQTISEKISNSREQLNRIVGMTREPKLITLKDEINRKSERVIKQLNNRDFDQLRKQDLTGLILEAIIRTDGTRPSLFIKNGEVNLESASSGNWTDKLAVSKSLLEDAIACVGRIELGKSGQRFFGTGFLIHENLIITNRHVLQYLGFENEDGSWNLYEELSINFGSEYQGLEKSRTREIVSLVYCGSEEIDFKSNPDHTKHDIAILALAPTNADDLPKHFLSLDPNLEIKQGQEFYSIGYPGRPGYLEYKQEILDELFSGSYGFKKLAPGLSIPPQIALSEYSFAHDATVLHGTSGSPILLIGNEMTVAGIHYAGQPFFENWGHVISRILDTPNAKLGKTLRQILEEYDCI